MLLDIIFLAMMAIAVFKGFKNGLVVAVFSIIGWILGLYFAVRFSDVASGYLDDVLDLSPRWLSLISFILVFLLVTLIVGLGAKLVEKMVDIAFLGWLNRLGGIVFYVILYILILSVILYFADKINILSGETIASSKVYPILQPVIIKLKQLF